MAKKKAHKNFLDPPYMVVALYKTGAVWEHGTYATLASAIRKAKKHARNNAAQRVAVYQPILSVHADTVTLVTETLDK